MKFKSILIVQIAIMFAALCYVSPAHAADEPVLATAYRVQEQYVDANGVLIYVKTFGRGAPLILLHGGPGASHDYLLPYLVPLARNHRLVFLDERGSGKSEKLQDVTQYTVGNMVEDVEAVRVALHL